MRGFTKLKGKEEAELNITSFMNLMIILVPVLLISMVFAHTNVLKLQLPQAVEQAINNDDVNHPLELEIQPNTMVLYYPPGQKLKTFPVENGYDFQGLSAYLQTLKQAFQEKGKDKEAITLLVAPNIDYQTIVSTMDTVRSFKAVVAASVVDAELFPNISFGDAEAQPKEEGAQ